ncbi:MAG TPA: hypothetical protein VK689_13390, partial [Armatimonadota bacterium]|nr:hypothetical protein [Armatimonadota bacterium]
MSMTESEVGEQGAPLEAARAAVAQVVSALQAGKRPRGRRSLKDAVRLFRGAGRFGEASRALGVLAQLELRHGKEAPALAAARQALRAAQQDPDPRAAGACRELLSETHSRLAQHAQAVKVAEAWLQDALRRDDAPDVVEALLRAALAEWAAGNKSEAFGLVDRALESARAADLEALAARAEALLGRLL